MPPAVEAIGEMPNDRSRAASAKMAPPSMEGLVMLAGFPRDYADILTECGVHSVAVFRALLGEPVGGELGPTALGTVRAMAHELSTAWPANMDRCLIELGRTVVRLGPAAEAAGIHMARLQREVVAKDEAVEVRENVRVVDDLNAFPSDIRIVGSRDAGDRLATKEKEAKRVQVVRFAELTMKFAGPPPRLARLREEVGGDAAEEIWSATVSSGAPGTLRNHLNMLYRLVEWAEQVGILQCVIDRATVVKYMIHGTRSDAAQPFSPASGRRASGGRVARDGRSRGSTGVTSKRSFAAWSKIVLCPSKKRSRSRCRRLRRWRPWS